MDVASVGVVDSPQSGRAAKGAGGGPDGRTGRAPGRVAGRSRLSRRGMDARGRAAKGRMPSVGNRRLHFQWAGWTWGSGQWETLRERVA